MPVFFKVLFTLKYLVMLISQQLFLGTRGVVWIFLLGKISHVGSPVSLPLLDPKGFHIIPPQTAKLTLTVQDLWVKTSFPLFQLQRLPEPALHSDFRDKPRMDLPWEKGSMWTSPSKISLYSQSCAEAVLVAAQLPDSH